MASNSVIVISHTDKMGALRTGARKENLRQVIDLLEGLNAGIKQGVSVSVQPNGSGAPAKASGTLTCASTVATNTFVINGVTFTADTDFDVGFNDDGTATNIAAAINTSANALVQYLVTASASGSVVTITAALPGITGNCITLAGTTTTLEASGARLTGGVGGDADVTTITL